MCTILVLFRVHPTYPLVIAANRDEYYERPASGPQVLGNHPLSIGGLDLKERGTWMGANERGIFAGLTNQRTHRPSDPSLRSRGEIVLRLLRAFSPEEIGEILQGIDPAEYNPFNIIFGTADALHVAYCRREQKHIEIEALAAGIHVLPNDRIGSPDFPRAERVRQRAEGICQQPWPRLAHELTAILSDHQLPPLHAVREPPPGSIFSREQLHRLQAVCIHGDVYGTCSATIMALERAKVAHYLYAPGPPCVTPFQQVTELLR